MTQIHEVFPVFQPLLGLHLMNGSKKYGMCYKHFLLYGKILKSMRV